MSIHDDPVLAAKSVAEAMRALTHATRSFHDPSDTYWAVGNVLSVAGRFVQVLEQLADAHRAELDSASDDAGSHTAGRAAALSAAEHLHKAAMAHAEAYQHLDFASQASGRISWRPPEPPTTQRPGPISVGAQVGTLSTDRAPATHDSSEPGL
ncbi:hypothetical protein [Isoptericola sp. NPDC019482]|uniref:hypothetical protein n=1 Tax=Isoptericola sp. NPDC019482 TaxID=3154688 RepID=UPI00347B1073